MAGGGRLSSLLTGMLSRPTGGHGRRWEVGLKNRWDVDSQKWLLYGGWLPKQVGMGG